MKQITLFLLIVVALSGSFPAFAQTRTKSAAAVPQLGNTDGITAAQLRNYLEFIASDELEGRDTPSRGLDIAAMFLASHLKAWGIKPAGDNGTYFQKFPLKRNRIDGAATKLELNGQAFNYGDDFLAGFVPGQIAPSNVVYVGHGWVIKSKGIDPYKGIEVKDKIVVVVNSLPKGITFNDLQGPAGGDWISPPMYAQANGARALIQFGNFGNLANWQGIRTQQTVSGAISFGNAGGPAIPTITANPRLIAALFQGEKASGSNVYNKAAAAEFVEPFDLKPTKKMSLTISVKTEETSSKNVVGILEGSDPVLKNEYVAIGAHYDHVGMNPNAPGDDKIYNGADDDGSGTVAVLSMAEAFSKGAMRPKRSVLFIWHAGEEKGLWGSEYFTDNPTVPIGSIIAELNIDMIGRYQNPGDENHPQNKALPKPNEIFLIGSKMMSTELGEVSEATNKSFLNLSFNYKYDDPKDPEQFFYRSDHFNYARKGIPIIFYMDGSHADYHQVSDSIEKINFGEMEKVVRTIFATGWELGNRAARPKVDKPLKLDGN
ncbi:MAG: M28 family peptidase [Acidobacteria bacterium]|nr:M28 family peptidase [Acidobacteriota bacterium]